MKFKNKTELILFLTLNILGSPFTLIISYILFTWIGLLANLALFYIVYRLWKYIGKHEGKLVINPSITLNNKYYKLWLGK